MVGTNSYTDMILSPFFLRILCALRCNTYG